MKNYALYADNMEDNPLFRLIRKNFEKRRFLTDEEFYYIVIWKANRAKNKIKRRIKSVKKLTKRLYKKSDRECLKILIEEGLRLPMASAILSVFSPGCAVYDVRVRKQLGMRDIAGRKNVVDLYFDKYLLGVKAKGKGPTIRAKGQWLWGKSFYEDLIKFINKKGG